MIAKINHVRLTCVALGFDNLRIGGVHHMLELQQVCMRDWFLAYVVMYNLFLFV